MSWGETLFLKKIIDGKKRFVSNDDVLLVASNKDFIFKTEADGSLRLKVKANSTSSTSATFKVEISSNKGYSQNFEQIASFEGGIYNFDIPVVKNATYTVTISKIGIGGVLHIDYVHICGLMTDYNYIKEVL